MAVEPSRCTLVTGPASSGKSQWAEVLAQRSGHRVRYLATGPQLPHDSAWQKRLQRHRQRRPACWTSHEVGFALSEAISACQQDELALVDSLGTWVAAGLQLEGLAWETACSELIGALHQATAPVILVGEEAGWGVVPATRSGGLFRERLGSLLQQTMACCDAAWLVLHGRAIDLLAISVAVPRVEPD
ncbi:MAG: bifunctional adenosylcobinamide kinase/adenosylcobinamide-phosphate guanylyltransferase [Cyanobacteriota bacterium]|nr:bifunctional adenosylcobinamide kinase/adenosylcobinamide-phosphate guanylyltransferase [Cyanobacteriota bacterium]